MSSNLRTYDAPVGYFVMAGNTILDGSGAGLYDLSSDTVYNANGTISARATMAFNSTYKNTLFDGNSATTTTLTLKDLGKTIYGAELFGADGASDGVCDVRKVGVVGAGLSTSFYVPLGTDMRATNGQYVASVKPSVALIGKLL